MVLQCETMGPHLAYFQIRHSLVCQLWTYVCGPEHCRLNFKGTSLSLLRENQRPAGARFFEDGGGQRWQPVSRYLSSRQKTHRHFIQPSGFESSCLSTQKNVLAQLETLSVCFVIDFIWSGFYSWGNMLVCEQQPQRDPLKPETCRQSLME